MPQLIDRLQSVFAGTYTLERELGGGGMSRVFLAEETALSRQVVIKVLPPDMAAGVNKERFELETQLAASLQHPLIVPILTAGSAAPVEPDLLYYVMPFIDGLSLRDRMDREGELPVHEAVRIIRDVADALARAHEAGVVHRDIKPDNVMLSGKHAMVTDFGIAKAVSASQNDSQTGLTQMGTSLGTPMYMAPEQAAGDPNVDHRADIYALGCMAYEMLAGRLPFESDSVQALLAAHISETPRPIAEHRPSIPAPLADAIMRCLAKKPADRWQSADQLSSVLDAVAGSSGVLTPVSTQAINVDGFVRSQSPVRVVATFAGVGAVLVGVVYLLMMQLGLPDWTLQGTAMLTVGAVLAAGFSAWRGGAGWPVIRRVLVGGYGLFAAGTVTYTVMRMLGIGPVATLVAAGVLDDQGRLILAQFENATSDSTLSESVTELLRIDLAQSETVTLMEPMQIAQVLRRMQRDPNTILTDDLAMEIAVREGVKAVLSGEIRSLAGDYIVSATLIATSTGETLAAARETASGGSLVGAVDRLSATLRERIGESLKTIRADAPLAEVTTASTEALRLFVQAERANDRSEADQAIALLKQALDVDSSFAMAHRKLGIILRNQGQDPERAVAAFTRAYELQDRLTDRERYLAEAAYYTYVTEDEAAAELAYTTLLDRYPTDPTALNNLAVNYRGRGR
ncbi:MAG: protein kinase, partial [Gemmatimonadetes bacterium]|nr:protein kinase [Gemmatimonadota bacterium]